MADFYAARSRIIPPLPWPTIAPPFSVYEDGEFTLIDRDAILAQIAEALAKPRDAEEQERHWLREQVFPVVEDFYSGYLQNTSQRTPFYQGSSST